MLTILFKPQCVNFGHEDVQDADAGVFLYMLPVNERRRYNVTSSLNGWAHTQNDPHRCGSEVGCNMSEIRQKAIYNCRGIPPENNLKLKSHDTSLAHGNSSTHFGFCTSTMMTSSNGNIFSVTSPW